MFAQSSPAFDRLRRQLVEALEAQLRGRRAEIPEAGRLLWSAFVELDGTRAETNPIAFAEIEAWARLKRLPLAPHHVDILRAMDAVLLAHVMAEERKAAGRAGS
jgi:hypothetical protein